MKPRPYSAGDRLVHDMRTGLDLLLADCARYFKRHAPAKWHSECGKCNRRQTADGIPANHDPCGMALNEALRITNMLWGIGLSDRYIARRKGPGFGKLTNQRLIRNRYGRIAYLRNGERVPLEGGKP